MSGVGLTWAGAQNGGEMVLIGMCFGGEADLCVLGLDAWKDGTARNREGCRRRLREEERLLWVCEVW